MFFAEGSAAALAVASIVSMIGIGTTWLQALIAPACELCVPATWAMSKIVICVLALAAFAVVSVLGWKSLSFVWTVVAALLRFVGMVLWFPVTLCVRLAWWIYSNVGEAVDWASYVCRRYSPLNEHQIDTMVRAVIRAQIGWVRGDPRRPNSMDAHGKTAESEALRQCEIAIDNKRLYACERSSARDALNDLMDEVYHRRG